MQTIGYQTRYRNASNDLRAKLSQNDKYTMNELDNIFFSQPECGVKKGYSSRKSSIHCGIGGDGSFQNKSDFLKQLNELLNYTAPKDGLRNKYNKLIRKGQEQEFVDLSLLKKMDSHLEWAMNKNENKVLFQKEQQADRVVKFLKMEDQLEKQARERADNMKNNILNIINKKVAGRAEGIEKVEGFLQKQERFNEEQRAIEAQERADKIAENNRLAAQRQAERDAEIARFQRQNCQVIDESSSDEPETPIFRKIKKQTEMKPSSFKLTPLKALPDVLEKQLAQMKLDQQKGRNSDIPFFGRRSEMTTMNTTLQNEDIPEADMPFAIANTVKHTHKKSLMLAGNNILSPKSSNPMRLSARKGSVTFESNKVSTRPSSNEEDMMRATSISFRNQELDKQINDQIKHLTRPQAEQDRDDLLKGMKKNLKTKVNKQRRSNLDYWDRPEFDRQLNQQESSQRHSSILENTLEAHHLHNKLTEKLTKKSLNNSPIRRMKLLQNDQKSPAGSINLSSLFSPKH